MSRALRNAALDYADRGWHVIPLRPHGKEPLGQLARHGRHDATADLPTVLRWWTRAPQANVAIVAGRSGLVVLDVDPRNGGDDSLHELEGRLGRLPETVSAETGGGGAHYLFRHPGEPLQPKPAPGLDVQDDAYIVAPPSVHPSGRPYAWDLAPDDVEVAELPGAWLEYLRPPTHLVPRVDLALRHDHDDPLRRIPAVVYVPRMTRRDVNRSGWACCPFHGGGEEKAPSLKCDGTLWACYGCPPLPGKRVAGGNIYDLAAVMLNMPLPLRGADFQDVRARLTRAFGGAP